MSKEFVIDEIDFSELEAEKYWQVPKKRSKEEKEKEVTDAIYSGNYAGALKIDGAYYRFIKGMNGDMSLQGRSRSVNGDFLNKIENVPFLMPFFQALPNGTVLLGEIYLPHKEGSRYTTTIMGALPDKAIARQEKNEHVRYYVFDVWAWDGKSMLNTVARDRFNLVESLRDKYKFDDVRFAKYFMGADLWDRLQGYLALGREGIVMTRLDSKPAPGKRTAHKTIKVKQELQETIDVVMIGANPPSREYTGKDILNWEYWYNTKTSQLLKGKYYMDYANGATIIPLTRDRYYGRAGSWRIGVYKDGKLIHCGDISGLTDEQKTNWKSYVGKVLEVSAMSVFEDTGKLRHPILIGVREDKKAEDCEWSQLG